MSKSMNAQVYQQPQAEYTTGPATTITCVAATLGGEKNQWLHIRTADPRTTSQPPSPITLAEISEVALSHPVPALMLLPSHIPCKFLLVYHSQKQERLL